MNFEHDFSSRPFFDRKRNEWTVTGYLGSGASGHVFRIERPGHIRALKVIDPDFWRAHREDPEQLERLQLQSELEGENVDGLVHIFEVDKTPFHRTESDDTLQLPYLLMDLAHGQSLTSLFGDLTRDEIEHIFDQLYFTARELIRILKVAHRDIKTDNIYYDRVSEAVTLLDLGIAKPIHASSVNKSETFAGTVRYSPHEFIASTVDYSQNVDAYISLTYYQLGAVLFAMLSGRHPYPDESNPFKIAELIRSDPLLLQVTNGEPGVVEKLRPFRDLLTACLQPDWQQRLDAVQEVQSHRRVALGLKPTIIMLYTGGTIAARVDENDDDLLVPLQVDGPEDPSLKEISLEISRQYMEAHLTVGDVAPELLWAVVPRQYQIFSENSDIEFLQVLLAKICEIANIYVNAAAVMSAGHDPSDRDIEILERAGVPREQAGRFYQRLRRRYILGVVVLHGTDTMSESSAYTCLACENLPCSVVFTGANRNLDPLEKTGTRNKESDGWENIVSGVYFLQAYGHFVKDVFVAFGGRIHYAINLAKCPSEGLAIVEDPRTQNLAEPFTYQNRGLGGQYAFRLIDDIICDNFFPVKGFGHTEREGIVWKDILDKGDIFGHARSWNKGWLSGVRGVEASESAIAEKFAVVHSSWAALSTDNVGEIPSSTSMVPVGDLTGYRAVLVSGYLSGSFAHTPRHRFTRFLETARLEAVPVFHVTAASNLPGRQYYKSTGIRKLYGVIPETALPLLAISASLIQDDQWEQTRDQDGRRSLILGCANQFMKSKGGMAPYILGDVGSDADRRDKIHHWQDQYQREFSEASSGIVSRSRGHWKNQEKIVELLPTLREASTSVSDIGDLLLRELELAASYKESGCFPEYLSGLYNYGFNFGLRRSRLFTRRARVRFEHDVSPRDDCEDVDNEIRIVESHIADCLRIGNAHGVGEMSLELKVGELGFLRGNAKIVFIGRLDDPDDLLADFPQITAACLSDHARRWMADLKFRTISGLSDNEYVEDISGRYSKLQKSVWVDGIPGYYFLGLGYLKAVACSALHLIARFGMRDIHLEEIRRSVHILSLESVDNELGVSFGCELGRFLE